jgi:hypothetical protein
MVAAIADLENYRELHHMNEDPTTKFIMLEMCYPLHDIIKIEYIYMNSRKEEI